MPATPSTGPRQIRSTSPPWPGSPHFSEAHFIRTLRATFGLRDPFANHIRVSPMVDNYAARIEAAGAV